MEINKILAEEFKLMLENEQMNFDSIKNMSEKYLEKLIPLERRLSLPYLLDISGECKLIINDKNNKNDALFWEFQDHISKKWKIYREETYDENNNICVITKDKYYSNKNIYRTTQYGKLTVYDENNNKLFIDISELKRYYNYSNHY